MGRAKHNINVLSLLIILPSFWFFPTNNYANYAYYVASIFVTTVVWLNRPNVKVRIDPFFYWLLGFLGVVMGLDLMTGAESLRMTAILLYSLSIIIYVVLIGVSKHEILLASLLGVSTMYIMTMITGHLSDHGNAAYLGAVVVVLILSKKYRIAILLFVLSITLLTRSALLATVVVLCMWYALRIYKSQSAVFRRGLLLTMIAALTIMPMILGNYFFDDPNVFILTSGRSYLYSIVWDEIVVRGIDVFWPVSNNFTKDLLTDNLLHGAYQGSNIYQEIMNYFFSSNEGCPHSTYLGFFLNYGVLGFITMFVLFVSIETRTSWPVVAYYIIVIGFQCEVFTPYFLVPFYILYRSTYFIENNGYGADLNFLCARRL